MEDDPEIKDIHSRTLNGFAFNNNSRIEYKTNAQYIHTYENRQKLMCQGFLVTPIYSETVWYQTQSQFPEKRKRYEEKLRSFMQPAIRIMEVARQQMAFQGKIDFLKCYDEICKNSNEFVQQTYRMYGYQWQCL